MQKYIISRNTISFIVNGKWKKKKKKENVRFKKERERERKLCITIFNVRKYYFTRLKNKIENNLTWEIAFTQSKWAKINSSSVIFIFSLYVWYC